MQQEPVASTSTAAAPPLSAPAPNSQAPNTSNAVASDPYLWAILDPDAPRDNPVEDKHRRLVRSHRSSPYDRDLKPNTKLRDDLGVCQAILSVMTSDAIYIIGDSQLSSDADPHL